MMLIKLKYLNSLLFSFCMFLLTHLTKCLCAELSSVSHMTFTHLMFSCLHRKLLTPPTVPCDQNALVGMATATLDDLQQIMPVCLFA